MGGSLSFEANAESICSPGEKCVLSGPIENATPEQLFQAMKNFVKAGKTKGGRESEFSVTETDDGLLVAQTFTIPRLFGGGTMHLYNVWKFDDEKLKSECFVYNNKTTFERSEPAFTNTCRILKDPVRVEFWQEAHEVRLSGPMLKAMLDKVLTEWGSAAKTQVDQPSPSDDKRLSVLSDPIEEATCTPELFWEYFADFLVKKRQATELGDGTIVEERSAMLDLLGLGAKNFAKHVINKEEGHIYCYEYGNDESLSDCLSTTHIHVHQSPFRLEKYNVQCACRRTGQSAVGVIQPFLEKVLKDVGES